MKSIYFGRGSCIMAVQVANKYMALSMTEAEYIATTEARKELLWIKNFLWEFPLKQKKIFLL